MEKHVCLKCGALAIWRYDPIIERHYCDDCVSRGCSCNEDENGLEVTDELGRLQPCWDDQGFEVD